MLLPQQNQMTSGNLRTIGITARVDRIRLRYRTLNRRSQDWDTRLLPLSQLISGDMWNILSMADGQGRALGSGSIPDVPLSPVGEFSPYNIFLERPVEMQGVLLYDKRKIYNVWRMREMEKLFLCAFKRNNEKIELQSVEITQESWENIIECAETNRITENNQNISIILTECSANINNTVYEFRAETRSGKKIFIQRLNVFQSRNCGKNVELKCFIPSGKVVFE